MKEVSMMDVGCGIWMWAREMDGPHNSFFYFFFSLYFSPSFFLYT